MDLMWLNHKTCFAINHKLPGHNVFIYTPKKDVLRHSKIEWKNCMARKLLGFMHLSRGPLREIAVKIVVDCLDPFIRGAY